MAAETNSVRRLTVGVFLTAGLVVAAFLLWRDGDGEDRVAASEGAAPGAVSESAGTSTLDDLPETSESGARTALDPGAAVRKLSVRSATGLELSQVTLLASDGKRTQRVTDGFIAISPDLRDVSLEVSGHVLAALDGEATEVVLEPKSSFALSTPGFEELVRLVQFDQGFNSPEAKRVLWEGSLSGWVTPDRWCVAYDHEALRGALRRPMNVAWSLEDLTLILAQLKLTGPEFVEVELDPTTLRARAKTEPLTVQVEGPYSSQSNIAFRIWTEQLAYTDPQYIWLNETHRWGVLQVYPPRIVEQPQGEWEGDSYTFERLPLGVTFGLAAVDSATGAHARSFFLHDGSPQTLELGPGLRLSGRVLEETGQPYRGPLELQWVFHDSPERSVEDLTFGAWNGWVDIETDAEGTYQLTLPKGLPSVREKTLELPPFLRLLVTVPGYPVNMELIPSKQAAEVRLPDIELRRDPLSWSFELPEEQLDSWDYQHVFLADGPSAAFSLQIRSVLESEDLRLHVQWNNPASAEGSLQSEIAFARDWVSGDFTETRIPTKAPGHVVLSGRFPYVRVDRNTFEYVPTREYRVATEFTGREQPSEADATRTVVVGWMWKGVGVPLATTRIASLPHPVALDFRAPPEGVTLWWAFRSDQGDAPATTPEVHTLSDPLDPGVSDAWFAFPQ